MRFFEILGFTVAIALLLLIGLHSHAAELKFDKTVWEGGFFDESTNGPKRYISPILSTETTEVPIYNCSLTASGERNAIAALAGVPAVQLPEQKCRAVLDFSDERHMQVRMAVIAPEGSPIEGQIQPIDAWPVIATVPIIRHSDTDNRTDRLPHFQRAYAELDFSALRLWDPNKELGQIESVTDLEVTSAGEDRSIAMTIATSLGGEDGTAAKQGTFQLKFARLPNANYLLERRVRVDELPARLVIEAE